MKKSLIPTFLGFTLALMPDAHAAVIAFYDAGTVTSGATTWTDSAPAAPDNTLTFQGFTAGAVVDGPGDVSPGTAINDSVIFNGTTQFANSTAVYLDNSSTVSLEIWFKPNSLTGNNQTLFETGGNNGSGVGLANATVTAGLNGTSLTHVLTAGEIADFVQAVYVVDTLNVTTTERFRLYINGVREANSAASGDFSGTNEIGVAYRSGSNAGTDINGAVPNGFFAGQIGFIKIYDTALSDAEVTSAFNAVIPEPTSFAMLLGGLGLLVLRRRR